MSRWSKSMRSKTIIAPHGVTRTPRKNAAISRVSSCLSGLESHPSNTGLQRKVSGFNRQRPEFRRMLDQIRPGDTIETINEAGGKFQSLSEPWANTTVCAGIAE